MPANFGIGTLAPHGTHFLDTQKISQRNFPTKDELLAFVANQSGKVGTREIARAFGLKNADRAALKSMLRELADEGRIARRRNKLHQAGALPAVVMADITGRDRDGELIAVPTEWDTESHGEAPRIRLLVPRKPRPGEVAGIGDRALIKTEEIGADGDAIRHRGRVIKLVDRAKQRVLGIFRTAPDGGRLVPIDKKNLGRELAIAATHAGGAHDGDL